MVTTAQCWHLDHIRDCEVYMLYIYIVWLWHFIAWAVASECMGYVRFWDSYQPLTCNRKKARIAKSIADIPSPVWLFCNTSDHTSSAILDKIFSGISSLIIFLPVTSFLGFTSRTFMKCDLAQYITHKFNCMKRKHHNPRCLLKSHTRLHVKSWQACVQFFSAWYEVRVTRNKALL